MKDANIIEVTSKDDIEIIEPNYKDIGNVLGKVVQLYQVANDPSVVDRVLDRLFRPMIIVPGCDTNLTPKQ